MTSRAPLGLSVVLVIAGAFIVFTGINVGFGGMPTLGWQGPNNFFQVTAEHAYLTQDSHVRFLGGVWAGIGCLFVAAPFHFTKLLPPLRFALILIFLGGLMRLTIWRTDVVFSPEIIGSLTAELVLVPVLFLWLSRTVGAHVRAE